MFTNLLDSKGFFGRYDFVYLPIDFHRGAGLGYAFGNCATPSDAEEMKAKFQGFHHWSISSQKVCDVCYGEPLQGRQAHIDRYRNSTVMHHTVPDECKPICLENGVRMPFPAPTKRIRAPKKGERA
jgi:hypothetical protein